MSLQVLIGAIACICIAFGGTKVVKAANCPPHSSTKKVGSFLYSETTSHQVKYDHWGIIVRLLKCVTVAVQY